MKATYTVLVTVDDEAPPGAEALGVLITHGLQRSVVFKPMREVRVDVIEGSRPLSAEVQAAHKAQLNS